MLFDMNDNGCLVLSFALSFDFIQEGNHSLRSKSGSQVTRLVLQIPEKLQNLTAALERGH